MMPDKSSLFALVPGICAIQRWQNISVVVWIGQATGPVVRKCAELTPLLKQDHGGGHSHVSIILSKTPPPNAEAQAALASAMEDPDADVACHGIVVEGTGFLASAMKSQLTRANLNSKRDRRFGLHRSVEELAHWMAEPHSKRTGVVVSATELTDLLTQLRADAVGKLASTQRA